jgi:hypothetical protein
MRFHCSLNDTITENKRYRNHRLPAISLLNALNLYPQWKRKEAGRDILKKHGRTGEDTRHYFVGSQENCQKTSENWRTTVGAVISVPHTV